MERTYKGTVVGRRIGLVLAVLGISVALTACGVEKTVDPVASAATKTEQAGGVKMAMTVNTSVAGKSFAITATGAFDQGQGELTMDLGSLLGSVGLPAGSGGDIELIFVKENGDSVIYAQFPFLASRLPGGKNWIRIDLETIGQKLGVDINQLIGQAAQSPAQALDMLRASGDVQKVGSATIDGVATTEYKGAIDLTKAAKLGGVPDSVIQRLADAGAPTSLPVEVWVGDADGFVRRIDLNESATKDGQTVATDVTVYLSDYGTTVSVSAPPADQVVDLSDLTSLFH